MAIFALVILIPSFVVNIFWLIRDSRWHLAGSSAEKKMARDDVFGHLLGVVCAMFIIVVVMARH